MENKKKVYSTPLVDAIDVKVEKGFAISSVDSQSIEPGSWDKGDTENWQY